MRSEFKNAIADSVFARRKDWQEVSLNLSENFQMRFPRLASHLAQCSAYSAWRPPVGKPNDDWYHEGSREVLLLRHWPHGRVTIWQVVQSEKSPPTNSSADFALLAQQLGGIRFDRNLCLGAVQPTEGIDECREQAKDIADEIEEEITTPFPFTEAHEVAGAANGYLGCFVEHKERIFSLSRGAWEDTFKSIGVDECKPYNELGMAHRSEMIQTFSQLAEQMIVRIVSQVEAGVEFGW